MYAGLLAVALVTAAFAFGVGSSVPKAGAVAGPLACDTGFYQVLSGRLFKLDPASNDFVAIGGTNLYYNAIGFNPNDGYIYGLGSSGTGRLGHLFKIASDGSYTDLGLPAGLPAASYFSADFDDAGNLIVRSSSTWLYKINVVTMTATSITLTGSMAGSDLVYIGGSIYSVTDAKLYRADLATGIVTAATITWPAGYVPGTNTYGAGWTNKQGQLFFERNTSGDMFRIDNLTSSAPTAVWVHQRTVPLGGGGNDGASCRLASDPFRLPTAVADTYTVNTSGTGAMLMVPATAGVLANDDGTNLTMTVTSAPTRGTFSSSPDGSFTYAPADWWSGADTFTYTVADKWGRKSAATTVTLNVFAPAGPTAVADTYTGLADQPIIVDAAGGVLANDTGTNISRISNDRPTQGGTITMLANGSFQYMPATRFVGTDTVTYTIADGFGRRSSAVASFVLSAPTGPTVAPLSMATAFATPLVVPATTGVLSDALGVDVAVQGHTEPANGVVVLQAEGSFTYTPSPGFVGVDAFTVTVVDAYGQTATATVSISVGLPPAPTAGDLSVSTSAATALDVASSAGLGTAATGFGISYSLGTAPSHGTAIVNADGSYTYTPEAGFVGTDTFTYDVTDAYGQRASATVTITVTAPETTTTTTVAPETTTTTVAPETTTTTVAPETTTTTVAPPVAPTVRDAQFSVPADGLLDVLATDGLLSGATGSGLLATVETAPMHGSVLVFDDGSFWYMPDPGYVGSDSFTFAATDAFGGSAIGTVTIDVVSTPAVTTSTTVAPETTTTTVAPETTTTTVAPEPTTTTTVAPATTTTTVAPETTTTTTASSPAPTAGDVAIQLAVDEILDVPASEGLLTLATGEGLTASLAIAPQHGAVVINPDGSFTYTPAAGFVGMDTFTYAVTDASGASVNGVVTIEVGGNSIEQTASSTTTTSVAVQGNAVVRDADGAATTTAPGLATTGTSSGPLVLIGTLSLLFGAALLFGVRRRFRS